MRALVFCFAVAIGGCPKDPGRSESPAEEPEVTLAAPSAWRPHERVCEAAAALPDLDLVQQAAIDRTRADAAIAIRGIVESNERLRQAMTASASDAKATPASFAPQVDDVAAAANAAGTAWTKVIADIHAVLTAAQRRAVARALVRWSSIPRAQRRSPGEASRPDRGEGRMGSAYGERQRLVERLQLTNAQRAKLDARAEPPAPRRRRGRKADAILADFGAPDFNPAALDLPRRMEQRARAIAAQRVLVIIEVRSVLRPEQLDLLAHDLRDAPLAE